MAAIGLIVVPVQWIEGQKPLYRQNSRKAPYNVILPSDIVPLGGGLAAGIHVQLESTYSRAIAHTKVALRYLRDEDFRLQKDMQVFGAIRVE